MRSSSDSLPAKVSGPALLLGVGGAAAALASLWMSWAVGDVDYGTAPRESGWSWMAYGDVLVVVTCAVVVAVIAAICARPQRHPVGLAIGGLVLTICAILGVLVIAALTPTTFTDFGTVDYRTGDGPTVAIAGLALAASGVIVAVIGAVPHERPHRPRWHVPRLHTHGM